MNNRDYLEKVFEWMRDHPQELDERVQRSEAVYNPPLECKDTGNGWLARKGHHVGTGATRRDAIHDLYQKLALVLGGPFGPLGNQPPPTL